MIFDQFSGSTQPEIFDEIDQAASTGILMGKGLYDLDRQSETSLRPI